MDLSAFDYQTQMDIVSAMNRGISAEEYIAKLSNMEVSPYFPYSKRNAGFMTLRDSEVIAESILTYLMDLPRDNYEPPDNNLYPRCRFWKYLYYDDRRPLLNPLPTREEKAAMKFVPFTDPVNEEKGYRLFAQSVFGVAQGQQQTTVRIFSGRGIPVNDFKYELSLRFLIFTSPQIEYLDNGVNRTEGIAQAIVEALHGVYIDGCGSAYFNRQSHPDCGVVTDLSDGKENIGRELTMGVTWTV